MKEENKTTMTYVQSLLIILISLLIGSFGWTAHKYYLLYKLNKDIENNIELQEENHSTELNNIITNNKVYAFKYIKEH